MYVDMLLPFHPPPPPNPTDGIPLLLLKKKVLLVCIVYDIKFLVFLFFAWWLSGDMVCVIIPVKMMDRVDDGSREHDDSEEGDGQSR